MFIIIPLLLIFVSAGGILFIVWRKKPYLERSLSAEGIPNEVLANGNFSLNQYWREFYPEIDTLIGKIDVNKYKASWFLELEKFVRKTRLIFLKIDNLTDSLIKKIRRVHMNGRLNIQSVTDAVEEKREKIPGADGAESQTISLTFLKNEEERLILEIAKNPKDPTLYEKLGDLYVEMENFIDAKESYEAAIELSPQNESLKQKLSSALEKLAPR